MKHRFYQDHKKSASIAYYALAFFIFFTTCLSYYIKLDLQYLKTQAYLKEVDQRLAFEGEIFHQVRLGKTKNKTRYYQYYVKDKVLYVTYHFSIPIYVEYDIIGDGSFVWRRNYDYIK